MQTIIVSKLKKDFAHNNNLSNKRKFTLECIQKIKFKFNFNPFSLASLLKLFSSRAIFKINFAKIN